MLTGLERAEWNRLKMKKIRENNYDLNDLFEEFERLLSKCQDDKEKRSLYLISQNYDEEYVKSITQKNLHEIISKRCQEIYNQRENKQNKEEQKTNENEINQPIDISNAKEEKIENNEREEKGQESLNTIEFEQKKSVILYDKDGKRIGVDSPYLFNIGDISDNKELLNAIKFLQMNIGYEDAVDRNNEKLKGLTADRINKALTKCKNKNDINTLKSVLLEMSKIGITGKQIYDTFNDYINMDNVDIAKYRVAERKKESKEQEESYNKEINDILDEFKEEAKREEVNIEVLKEIYERGQVMLVRSRENGRPMTEQLSKLQDKLNSVEGMIKETEEIDIDRL
ncbi:MAG: hypothetical protein IJH76_00425 [Clostridia bacterium]|nr:hypothetical protein [Clostridia bacterium]